MLEKTLESPLDCKEIQLAHSKGDQSWVFIGRNDAKAETPILWPLHAKSWLTGKDSDAGRDWGQEEKGMTEDEMAGWHHWLDGHESEWTPGVGDGQGGLACCYSWGRKESDTTGRLSWTELRAVIWSLADVSKECATFSPNLADVSHPLNIFSIINIIIINGILHFLKYCFPLLEVLSLYEPYEEISFTL